MRRVRSLLSCCGVSVAAHVGSPDVFVDGVGGTAPDLRHDSAAARDSRRRRRSKSSPRADDIAEVRIVPLPLDRPRRAFAPVADVATRSMDNPRLFTGTLWMMTAGAWQVRVAVTGDAGTGQLSVPVPTLPKATLEMSPALGVLLPSSLLLLCTRAGGHRRHDRAGRGARAWRARRPAARAARTNRRGDRAPSSWPRRCIFGNTWWGAEAASYSPLCLQAARARRRRSPVTTRYACSCSDPGWLRSRRLDDFVRDHGHLMHLFVVSPTLDHFWHLHPREVPTGTFEQSLPPIPVGHYEALRRCRAQHRRFRNGRRRHSRRAPSPARRSRATTADGPPPIRRLCESCG